MEHIAINFASAATVLALITTLSAALNKWRKWEDWPARLASWAVSVIVVAVGCYFDFGIFEGLKIDECALQAFYFGLAANGVFTIPVVKQNLKGGEE